MSGRLNSFQRTMLDWNDLHPYNAVHVVRVAAPFDPELLMMVITATLNRRKMGLLEIDREAQTFSYQDGIAESALRVVETGSREALLEEIEWQINTPFAWQQTFCPFRFFVAPDAEGFRLGLAYFHAIADAEAVVYLFREMVESYVQSGAAKPRVPELYPETHDTVTSGLFWRKVRRLPAQANTLLRSCRPFYRNRRDASNGFDLFSLPTASLKAGLQASKLWDATLNDLFLAVLLKELAPIAKQRVMGTRKNISVGCIVNLRRELGLDGVGTFGLFLGSFIVSHSALGDMSLQSLTRDVHRQTHLIKEQQLFLATSVDLALARAGQRFFSLERRSKFYQKNHPLWGGITNMNLNALWRPDTDPRPVGYFRAVSTGPATPLVFSITTANEEVNIAVSYRRTVFAAEQIAQMKSGFLNTFAELERGG